MPSWGSHDDEANVMRAKRKYPGFSVAMPPKLGDTGLLETACRDRHWLPSPGQRKSSGARKPKSCTTVDCHATYRYCTLHYKRTPMPSHLSSQEAFIKSSKTGVSIDGFRQDLQSFSSTFTTLELTALCICSSLSGPRKRTWETVLSCWQIHKLNK